LRFGVRIQRQALLLLALSVPRLVSSQTPTLTSTERTIASAVDSQNREALALLERLVNINSGTMNFAGVRQVGDVLRAQFDSSASQRAGSTARRFIAPVISWRSIQPPVRKFS
jgi:hypothetical protein